MLSSLFLISLISKCHHDLDMDNEYRRMAPKKFSRGLNSEDSIIFNTKDRKNIRVKFDLTAITSENKVDSKRCYEKSTNCQATDILDSEKISVIKETMENVESYINKLLNVTAYVGDLPVHSIPSGLDSSYYKKLVPDTDLYIFVVARPFGKGSSTMATASALSSNSLLNDLGRPLTGLVTLNPSKIPKKAENYDSGDRQFFVTVVHELTHVLCFSKHLFGNWVDRSTGLRYARSTFTTTNSYGIQQTFIRTPKLLEWVNNRFQVYDDSLKGLGLELEDGGGTGTAGSHPNSRLYFTDVMQGVTYGPGYFSGVFMNALYDSGWYDPNYTMQEDLVYMDMKIHGTVPNQNVLTNPPKVTFPSDYLCSKSAKSYCFYDHSYKGFCDANDEKTVMEKDSNYPKNYSSWYNPDGGKISDEEVVDYTPIIFPAVNCRDEAMASSENARSYEYYGPSGVCVLSTLLIGSITQMTFTEQAICVKGRCGSDGKLRITLGDGIEQLCTRKDKKIYQKGKIGYVRCPNSHEACATLSKTPMINVNSIVPDRGPSNGQNFILIKGEKIDKMKLTKLELGEIDLLKFNYTMTSKGILVKLPVLNVTASKIMVPQNLYINAEGEPNTTIENIYTFTNIAYGNAGWINATPAMVLIVITFIIGFII